MSVGITSIQIQNIGEQQLSIWQISISKADVESSSPFMTNTSDNLVVSNDTNETITAAGTNESLAVSFAASVGEVYLPVITGLARPP